MKFGSFKLGKKDKAEVEDQIAEEEAATPIDEIVQGAEPVMPHPPLQELSLDADAAAEELDAVDGAVPAEEEGEPVKLVEVQPAAPVAAVAPPPPADAKKNDPMDLASSIGNIFTDVEDEDNPLINLIRALPEVAASELIDDLKEINDIIKDWQKK
jgi:hypothetical protein